MGSGLGLGESSALNVADLPTRPAICISPRAGYNRATTLTVEAQREKRCRCCSMGDQKRLPDENPGMSCQGRGVVKSHEPAGPNHPTKPLADPFPSATVSE